MAVSLSLSPLFPQQKPSSWKLGCAVSCRRYDYLFEQWAALMSLSYFNSFQFATTSHKWLPYVLHTTCQSISKRLLINSHQSFTSLRHTIIKSIRHILATTTPLISKLFIVPIPIRQSSAFKSRPDGTVPHAFVRIPIDVVHSTSYAIDSHAFCLAVCKVGIAA